MSVRPGGRPAAALTFLLLSAQGDGMVTQSSVRCRLISLGYVRYLGGWMCRLTPAGVAAARALQASS